MSTFKTLATFALRCLVLAALVAIAPGRPSAAPKQKPACGLSFLPAVPGNTWIYQHGDEKITVLVKSIQASPQNKNVTEILVTEMWRDEKVDRKWTCTREGLSIGPDSFFFSGEPGGAVGGTYTETSHGQFSVPHDRAMAPGVGWQEAVKGTVERIDTSETGATHPPAQIEVEKHIVIEGYEAVATDTRQYNRALKMGFDLRGRALVEEEKFEMPIKSRAALYFVKDLGIVRLDDAFERVWLLAGTTVPYRGR